MRYLFYVNLSYSFSVLRPIEIAINREGGTVAWFVPEGSEAEKFLQPNDNRLSDIKEVKAFAAHAWV